MSNEDLKALPRDELAKLLPDMTEKQIDVVLKAQRIDLSALDSTMLSPEVAFKISQTSTSKDLENMGTSAPLAMEFELQLSTYLAGLTKPLGKDEQAAVDVARAVGGRDASAAPLGLSAFGGDMDRLGRAFQSNAATVEALLKQLATTGELTRPDVEKAMHGNININTISEMVRKGDPTTATIGIEVARAIKAQGGIPAWAIKKNPILNKVT